MPVLSTMRSKAFCRLAAGVMLIAILLFGFHGSEMAAANCLHPAVLQAATLDAHAHKHASHQEAAHAAQCCCSTCPLAGLSLINDFTIDAPKLSLPQSFADIALGIMPPTPERPPRLLLSA